jgi:predicted metal-binding membrane protein
VRSVSIYAAAALFAASAIAWSYVMLAPGGMGMSPVAFIAAWTVMMAAMMLPSAAPLVLLYRRGASAGRTTLLVAGYLFVWAVAGVPIYFAFELIPMSMAPAVLAVAGIYQLTPAKRACLRQCRSPADFLVLRWGRGAFRLGLEHGAWCLGCCWALMVVLVLVGMMGLAWVVGLATLVAIEKLSEHGVLVSRVTGAAFLLAALYEVMT